MTHVELVMSIGDEDLEMLADIYRDRGSIPYASSLLMNGVKIRAMKGYPVRFMSPGGAWREDGTFFVILEYGSRYDVAIFTLDQNSLNTVYAGLMYTKRIHFERPIVFKDIHQSVYPTVLKVIKDKELQIHSEVSSYIYRISKEEALKFQIECPEIVELKKISECQAEMLNATWTNRYSGSQHFIKTLVRMNSAYVAYSKTNGELLSWALKSVMGQIGIVETMNDHQRKGYGTLVAKSLARSIATGGEDPVALIETSNKEGKKFFEELGFENVGLCYDIVLMAKGDLREVGGDSPKSV